MLDEAQGGCPVDTGKLKSSGLVSISRNTQTQFYMRIGFYANYALFVHEKNAYHKVGHSHFLIIPFNNQKGNLMSALRSDLKDIL